MFGRSQIDAWSEEEDDILDVDHSSDHSFIHRRRGSIFSAHSFVEQAEAQNVMPSVSSHRKRLFTRDIVEVEFDDQEH